MNKVLFASIIGIAVMSYFLYMYNYNEAKSAISLVMPKFMSVYALPTFQADIDERFNELVEKFIPQEYRYLTENLTESQRNVLSGVLAVGGDSLVEEKIPDMLKDIGSTDIPPDPEHEKLMKIVNDTETARSKLPFISAPSPVRFNTDETPLAEVPYTAPGQIALHITSGDGNRSVLDNHKDFIPYGWSANINFAAGTKSVSYSGMGDDYSIVDCPPGTPYGVMFQKREDSGYMEIFITASEFTPVEEFGEMETTYAPYGVIAISGTCPFFNSGDSSIG